MPSKATLNAKNPEALGAERLAELLIEISTGDAAAKRRLRMELAGTGSPGELPKEVRNRLTSIARSQSFIDWRSVRAIAGDLETQGPAKSHWPLCVGARNFRLERNRKSPYPWQPDQTQPSVSYVGAFQTDGVRLRRWLRLPISRN